jgi:hypothetical protein
MMANSGTVCKPKYNSSKKFSSTSSTSKRRNKSFKRFKENEFRKLLRPAQTNRTIDIDSNENSANVSSIALYDMSNMSKQMAKSDQKIYRARSRPIYDELPSSMNILRDKCMNSVK